MDTGLDLALLAYLGCIALIGVLAPTMTALYVLSQFNKGA